MRIEAIAWFDMPKNGKWHGQNVMPQQELIRCKDCKHYLADPWGYGNCGHGEKYNRVSDNDYCSWAERKEE